MANRYWVGGTGTWDSASTTNWRTTSGGTTVAAVPTAADTVIFDQAGTYTVTLTGTINCLDIQVTAGTVTFTSTGNLRVSGSMSLISATIWNANGTITFIATTSQTISTNGVFITAGIVFNGIGGTWTLGSALSTSGTTLTAGTLNLNNFTLTTGIFSSNNSNTRSISFGTGDIILTSGTADTTVLTMATATGFTWTGTGGFTSIMNTTRVFTFGTTSGGTATNAPNLTLSSGASVATLTTGSYFNKLDFGTTTFIIQPTTLNLNALTLSSGGSFSSITANMVGTGSINPNGNTVNSVGVLVINNGAGTTTLAAALSCNTFTMTSGTINFATFNLTCSSTATYTAGTLNNIGTISCTTFTVNTGTFTLTQGTITPSTSFVVSGNGTFNYNGGTLSAVPTFTQTAGNVTLGQAYSVATAGASTYTLTAGTLNLANFTLTTGIFSSTGSGTRSIAFGSGNIVLSNTSAATTVLSMATATNFTWTGTGGFQTSAAITRTLTFGSSLGGSATNAPNLTLTGSGTAIITFTTTSYFNNLNFGTTAFTIATTNLNLNGNLTLSSGGTFTGLTATMVGTSTITTNSKSIAALTINHTGTTTLGDQLSFATATATTTLTSGTLNLNGFNLTTGIFSSNNSSARSIAFGANNIVLAHTTAGTTVLSMATATNFTWTGTGGFVTTMSVTRTFNFGSTAGSASSAPNLSIISGASVPTFTDGSWFTSLNFTGSTCTPALSASLFGVNVDTLTLASGGTYTGLIPVFTRTQTWTPQFSKQLGGIGCNITSGTLTLENTQTYTATSVTVLTAGTLDLGGYNLTTGSFNGSGTATRSIAFGSGNIVLSNTVAATTVLSMATATNFTWTGTGGFQTSAAITRTLTFGSTAGGSVTNAPDITLTGSGAAILTFTTGSWFNNLNFGTTASTVAATALKLNSLTLSSSGTYTNLSLTMTGTSTLNFNGKAVASVTIDNGAGTTTLVAALSCTTFTMTSGTINFATFNLTCSSTATYTAGTLNNIGTISCTTFTVNTGTFTLTSGTITPSTSFVVSGNGTFNYNGGTLSAVPTFTQTAGTVTLGQAYALTATGTYTLTAGTLTLGGVNLTAGIFSSDNTTTRSITFGTGNIVLTHTTANTVVLNIPTLTGFSCTGTGGFTSDASIIRSYLIGTTTPGGVSGSALTSPPSLSFTGSGAAIPTLNSPMYVKDLNFGTTAFTLASVSLFQTGNLTLSTGGTFTGLTLTVHGSNTITSNGKTIAALTIGDTNAGISGTVTLNSALTINATGTTSLFVGTLNLNDFTLTTGIFAGGANTTLGQIINFGTGDIVLNSSVVASTVLSCGLATYFTLTGTGGFVSDASITRTYIFGTTGGASSKAPNLTLTGSGTAVQTFTAVSWFNKLDFGTTAFTIGSTTINVNAVTLSASGTFTSLSLQMLGTGTITSNSKTIASLSIQSTSGTTTLGDALSLIPTGTTFFVSGTLNLNGFNLTTGIFSSTGSSARSIAFGANNIVLAHTTAATTVLSFATATGFTYTGTGGFTTDASITRTLVFGTIGGSATNSPNLTLTNSGTAVLTLTTGSYFKTLSFGTTAFTIATTTLNLSGLTLSSGGTFTSLTATMVGTGTLNFNGKSIAALTINSTSSTTTAASAINCTTFTVTSGTIDFATYSLTCTNSITGATNAFAPAGTLNLSNITCATYTVNGTLTITSGQSLNATTSFVTATAFTYNGGTLTTPTVTHTSGTVTLGAALTLPGTCRYELTAGTLSLAGFTLTTGIFASSGTATRSIAFGTGNIVLSNTVAATTVLSMATATNFTWTGTGGFQTSAAITRTLTFGTTGGSVTNAPDITLTGSGTAIITFTTASWFNNLNFGTTAFNPGTTTLNLNGFTLSATGTYTTLTPTMVGTGTITSSGNTTLAILIINNGGSLGTTTLGAAFTLAATGTTTLTSGVLDLGGYDLTTGIFSSSNSNVRYIGFGSNYIVLAHTTAGTTVLAMSNITNFNCTANNDVAGFSASAAITRTYTMGVTGSTGTNQASLKLTGSGTAVQTFTTGSYFWTLDFGTTAFAVPTTTLGFLSLILSSGGTFSALTANNVQDIGLSGPAAITSNGNTTLLALSIVGITLLDTLTMLATGTVTISIAGAITLNGFNLTTGIFSVPSGGTVNFGSGNIVLAHTTAGTTVLSIATATSFSWTGTGGFQTDAAITRTLTFGTTGGTATNAPNLTLTGSGTAVLTLTTGSWFNNLNFGTTAFILGTTALNIDGSLTLSSGGTFTGLTLTMVGTGSITTNGKPIAALTINSTLGTTTLNDALSFNAATATTTLTSGALNLNNFTLTTGIFSSTGIGTRSIAFGSGNIVLAHTTAGQTVLSMATATGFTYTGTGGFTSTMSASRTFTFGTTGGSTTNAPNLTLSSGSSIATLTTGSYFNKLDFGTTTFTLAATSLNLNSLTLSATGTYTSLTATMVGTGAIIANGKSIPTLTINHSGITQLGSALTTTASVTLTAGTLALAGFTLTSVNFISGTATTRSISGAGTGIISLSGNWTVTDGTGWTRFSEGNGYKINMTSASSKTFSGAGGSYGTLVQAGAGAMTISGSNVFADIQATTRPSTITFTAGTTQTLEAFTLAGTAGNLVTIGSTVPDSAFTLSNAISTSTANYLSIRDCYVTGGAPWYNNNGTNTRLTNNSNWNTAAAAMSLFF